MYTAQTGAGASVWSITINKSDHTDDDSELWETGNTMWNVQLRYRRGLDTGIKWVEKSVEINYFN